MTLPADPAGAPTPTSSAERGPQPPPAAVAVIGAHGFLGRALVQALHQAGVPTAEFTRATPFSPDACAARTVYYLASSINPAIAERQPELVDADRRQFDDFLTGLVRAGSPAVVVLSSSGGTVYDPTAVPPYAETSPVRPRGRYGTAKLALEERLRASGLRHVVLRISNVYGPGQPTGTGQGVIAHWLVAAAKGEPIVLYGNPEASRDYVYVDDVADALVRAGTAAAPPAPPAPVINVGSGVPTTLASLAGIVRDVTGELEIRSEGDRGFDVARTWLDVRLAAEALGWAPHTPLAAGIRRTWTALAG